MISLTVDYAIQAVSHYREQRATGQPVVDAVRTGLRNVTIPLMLAAVTTIVSVLANLFSPIAPMGDFGIVAGVGVGMSLIVVLTLLPAGGTIIDRRRESRGTLAPPRLVANALPGIGRVAEVLGGSVARRPAPYIIAVIAVTIGFGFAAQGSSRGSASATSCPGAGPCWRTSRRSKRPSVDRRRWPVSL